MTIGQDRWLRLSEWFDAAVELAPRERRAFLAARRVDAPELAAELERMLAADDAASGLDDGIAALVTTHGAVDADEAPVDVDAKLGPWRLGALLGRGGMGSVFEARREDDGTGQRAAIKRLRRRWDGSAQAQRFLQERRILAQLSHSNIPALLDHGLDDEGRPWFALEFVDGRSLVEWADARRLGLRERVVLFLQVCAAVQHAHERFVVHRDLKPANILVDGGGRVQVLDFGVAKRLDLEESATGTGVFAGFTPEYAAPEQVSGGTISAATDVHGLGAVLYQLLSGRLPHAFARDDLRGAAEAIATRDPERLDRVLFDGDPAEVQARIDQRATSPAAFRRFVRGDLGRIVQTALAKEPGRRYASVQGFADDLRRFLDGRPVSVAGNTLAYRARKFARRNRWGVAMAALATLALAAGIAGVAIKNRQVEAEAARANRQAALATRQTARARQETERVAAANEFLRSVFSMAAANNAGTPNLSLRDALDLAVKQIRDSGSASPQLRVRFLLAAADSYEALGEPDKAQAAAREALDVQQAQLPGSKEDRAAVLAAMAWQRMNFEPQQALAWAKEAVALLRAMPDASESVRRDAYSILGNVQYTVDDVAGAIATTRDLRALMLRAGTRPTDNDVITTWSNEAVMLSGLGRYDEAAHAHEQVIALRAQGVGADSVATALERVYYGFTLNRARRYAQALAQLQPAQAILLRELGTDHDNTQQANLGVGRALIGLGRARDAIAPLQAAHAYGERHAFEQRQDVVGASLAQALAQAGRCGDARAVLADLARRRIVPGQPREPLAGTACR